MDTIELKQIIIDLEGEDLLDFLVDLGKSLETFSPITEEYRVKGCSSKAYLKLDGSKVYFSSDSLVVSGLMRLIQIFYNNLSKNKAISELEILLPKIQGNLSPTRSNTLGLILEMLR